MTTIEQELQAELSRLRAAVDYIEEAKQRTAEVLKASAATQAENQRLHNELQELQNRITALGATGEPHNLASPLVALAGGVCLLLVGGSVLLRSK